MEAEMSSIMQELDTVNYSDEIIEVRQYDKRVKEMHEKMLRIHSEINKITKEVENLRLEEAERRKTLQSNVEEIGTLKAALEIQQGTLSTLQEVIKECNGICWPDFNQETELTKKLCDNLMEHFGLKVEVEPVETDIWRAKFKFLEGGEILLDFHIHEKTFSLQSMTPIHPNFDHLRTYLHESQDISGFMCHSRKYFLSQAIF